MRVALFGEAAGDALGAWLNEGRPVFAPGAHAALFLNRSGERLSSRSMQQIVRSAGEAAGIVWPVTHQLVRRGITGRTQPDATAALERALDAARERAA